MGATRMFRLLAAMLLLAGLMLGQSGNGSFAYTGLAANGSALTAMHGESGGSGQSEGHSGGPSHGCHHSSCSQTFLVKARLRSEEHTSELQSLMRISYAVFCLKKNKQNTNTTTE